MIKARTSGNISIFDIVGTSSDTELTKQTNLTSLLREIDECYRLNRRQIIVNLERVSCIDFDAVIELTMKQSSREGLLICFYGMQSRVRHALKNSGFLEFFDVYTSQREALESFK